MAVPNACLSLPQVQCRIAVPREMLGRTAMRHVPAEAAMPMGAASLATDHQKQMVVALLPAQPRKPAALVTLAAPPRVEAVVAAPPEAEAV